MKSLLAFLVVFSAFGSAMAEESPVPQQEIILPASPPQKVFSRYQNDFDFHHDRGFLLSVTLGPQWNHSIDKPNAKGVRFGSKINAGWFVADGFALFGSCWGSFLESASLIAGGPGIGFFFDSTNIGIDLSLGIGRAFNVISRPDIKDFSETVLAGHLAFSKFWWLSGKTSLGLSLYGGAHGLTLSEGRLGTFGWSTGLGLAFLFG